MVWPAPDSGRSLEVRGDVHPRGMITLDRTRLIGWLPPSRVLSQALHPRPVSYRHLPLPTLLLV